MRLGDPKFLKTVNRVSVLFRSRSDCTGNLLKYDLVTGLLTAAGSKFAGAAWQSQTNISNIVKLYEGL